MLLVGRGDVVVCHSSTSRTHLGNGLEEQRRCSQAEIQHQERPLEMPLSPSAPSGLRLSLWDPLLLRLLFQEGHQFLPQCPHLESQAAQLAQQLDIHSAEVPLGWEGAVMGVPLQTAKG